MIGRVRLFLIVFGSMLIGIGVHRIWIGSEIQHSIKEVDEEIESLQAVVEVSGAVNNPGVVSVLLGSTRVKDAIDLAGGIKNNDVDKQYMEVSINMSSLVRDGQKIHIPRRGDAIKRSSLVSINNASRDELESLPGVGEVTAEKIINNRPYNRIDDLHVNNVISQAVFRKIENLIDI